MSSRIRALLIDDSAFMRKVIADIINTDSDIELVGIARNGKQGTEMTMELKPDVVITDMVMPDFDGLYLVNLVMEQHPVPIILLSSLERTDTRIFDALKSGAFEFIDKPANLNDGMKDYRLLELIRQASKTDITILKARQLAGKNNQTHSFSDHLQYEIIVIGASTGGPGAVEYIIHNLPQNLQIPVVIVQHMPHRFLQSFADRLNGLNPLTVKIGHRGEELKGGHVYIAPGDGNMTIESSLITKAPMISFSRRTFQEFNNPSVDCLFESAAAFYEHRCIGVVLTGMGKDGMAGLQKIREKGGYTIAQDETSSVVYGMPKAAVDSGAALQVVNLKEIPGFLVSCL